ncbi:hypothetical protein B0H12DRAFT_229451 [Mycena haematopus]|nr:hypothetical protein B0H12DRAFT_229451 [Mycena haematopus]
MLIRPALFLSALFFGSGLASIPMYGECGGDGLVWPDMRLSMRRRTLLCLRQFLVLAVSPGRHHHLDCGHNHDCRRFKQHHSLRVAVLPLRGSSISTFNPTNRNRISVLLPSCKSIWFP